MTLNNEEKKETVTLKEVGKYIFFIFLSLAAGNCYRYFEGAGQSPNEIKSLNTRIDKEVELLNVHRGIQDGKILDLESRTKKLQESRDELSKFYVTRPEFNRIIDEQKQLLEKMDGKLDKLTDKIYDK